MSVHTLSKYICKEHAASKYTKIKDKHKIVHAYRAYARPKLYSTIECCPHLWKLCKALF